jgi:dolichyl-phosphate-mannose-protein mannosyltransferase
MHRLGRLFLTTLILVVLAVSGVSAAENLVKNPSFENGAGAMPSGWLSDAYIKKSGVTDFKWESNKAHSGSKKVTVINHSENDSKFLQDVPVKENAIYKISCWTMTENVGTKNKGANISIEGKMETSPDIKGTNGKWEQVALYAKTGKGINSIKIMMGIGGYGSMNTGEASFDDVAVEEVNAIPGGAVVSTVNAEKPGPPAAAGPAVPSGSTAGGTVKTSWLLAAGVVLIVIAGAILYNRRLKASPVKDMPGETQKTVERRKGDDLL